MILELVLTATSVTGVVVAIGIGRRHVTAAEAHAADAADALAENRILAASLQELTDHVNNSVAWTEWTRHQQAGYHLQLVDRTRDADAREARLAEWQKVLLGQRTPMVLSVDELNEQFKALTERIGPLAPPVDDEPTVETETPAHLIAVYDGEPGHFVSDAMPADFTAALERVITERGLDVDQMIAEAETGTDEDGQGPDTTVDEPVEADPAAFTGGDGKPDDDAVTLPGGGEPKPKVNALKLGGNVRKLIEEQVDARQREFVGAVAARGTLPTQDQPASPQTPPGPPVPKFGPRPGTNTDTTGQPPRPKPAVVGAR